MFTLIVGIIIGLVTARIIVAIRDWREDQINRKVYAEAERARLEALAIAAEQEAPVAAEPLMGAAYYIRKAHQTDDPRGFLRNLEADPTHRRRFADWRSRASRRPFHYRLDTLTSE
jgi:hypothetical protein